MPHEEPDLSALPLVAVPAGLADLVAGPGAAAIEQALPPFLARQRWFGAKARVIRATRILDHASLPVDDTVTLLCIVRVEYESGEPDEYFVPMAVASGHRARAVRDHTPGDVIARAAIGNDNEEGFLYDAGGAPETATALLAGIQTQLALAAHHGSVRGVLVAPDALSAPDVRLEAQRMKADHSNTALTFADRFIMKLFRRLEPGPNPDYEIGAHLTRQGFKAIPRLIGGLEYAPLNLEPTTLGILQDLVANRGTAWDYCLDELGHLLEAPDSERLREPSIAAARLLGLRTGEMHRALAAVQDEAFVPEPLDAQDLTARLVAMHERASAGLDQLAERLDRLDAPARERADLVLAHRSDLLQRFHTGPGTPPYGARMRVHGDYHLGQVLRVRHTDDFVIIDFEGEPARTLAERRSKQSPLKDVAGMLRSFAYAAESALAATLGEHPDLLNDAVPAARAWRRDASAAFLDGYREVAGEDTFLPADEAFDWMLDVFVLDKVFYELGYELNSRPEWAGIPLAGLAAFCVDEDRDEEASSS